jgi:shikimate kinase
MPLIYITGPTGAGKSTIRASLHKRGYEAYDTDEDGISLHYNRQTGQPVDYPRDKRDRTPKWHAEHAFNMSQERIEQLAKQAENKTIFLCGVAANDLELAHYFSKILCLVIDIETMKQRVATRTTNNFGKAPDELKTILKYYQPVLDKYTKAGATMIDAKQPLEEVVNAILQAVGEVDATG